MPFVFDADLGVDAWSLQKDPKLLKKHKFGTSRFANSNMPDLAGVQLAYTEIWGSAHGTG